MQRNIEIVAKLLEILQKNPNAFVSLDDWALAAKAGGIKSPHEFTHHFYLARDKGLIAHEPTSNDYRLTWDGHDYLESRQNSGLF
ncbi:DUF2513 domain-containing protein [Burkholderia cepacia]|uniref:DUF2513 domain-containing protein n=1 Tax=Burkholderia cepacia TaxID=292 RepID=UPI001CF11355|nr:DUF2513 domain-containing protein [Burkholderia cepacia]MCA8213715.1 DUF2513 domain-containing protein [Burkholderia cepacia]